MTPPARALWRFLRREGGDYVFGFRATWDGPCAVRRIPVERFWGGAR